MLRSLFSGVTGLRAHQTKMDVIGNNISNVNTVGFKSSSVNFTDVFYQTSMSASGPNNETGTAGRNPMQIGLGSNISSITTSIGLSGASQRTDNPFNIMIEGDSFFVINSGGNNYFTKAGVFELDAFGNLATPNGALVMGWEVDKENPTKTVASEVKPLRIKSPENIFSEPEATQAAVISGNIDSKDIQIANTGRAVNIPFYDNLGYSYTAQLKVTQLPNENERYSVALNDVKDSNGKSVFVKEVKDADGQITYEASNAFSKISFGGTDLTIGVDTNTGELTIATTNPILEFNASTGELENIVGAGGAATDKIKKIDFSLTTTAALNPFKDISIDFSTITMYATSGSTSLEAHRGDIEGKNDGRKAGNMIGHSIDTAGKIYGHYDNGDQKLLGQIATALFSNPAGLEAIGNNMFAATQNSGTFDGIGYDVTQAGGSFATGFLEMSNVDLSAEFTQMITTQRGFQANSRIITTSDTLLEELINLKR